MKTTVLPKHVDVPKFWVLALTGNLFLILIFISSFFDCEVKLVFHAIKCHSYMFVHEWLAPSSLTFALIISPLLKIVSITTDPGQYHFQLLFEECCKQKDEKGGGGDGDTSSSEHYVTKKYGARKCKIDWLFYHWLVFSYFKWPHATGSLSKDLCSLWANVRLDIKTLVSNKFDKRWNESVSCAVIKE